MDTPDFNGIRMLASNNDDFYKELLQTFVSSTEKGLVVLNERAEVKEWKQVGEIAHQLAAPFKHFNAIQCYTLLKKIERLGREEETGSIEDEVIEFRAEATIILNLVKEELEKHG